MKITCTILALLLTATVALAAEPATEEKAPTADGMQQLMEASFGAMVPMMGKMAEVTKRPS